MSRPTTRIAGRRAEIEARRHATLYELLDTLEGASRAESETRTSSPDWTRIEGERVAARQAIHNFFNRE